MADRKVLLIVGNGFNYLVLNIIKYYPHYRMQDIIKSSREDIEATIKSLIYLYSDFKTLDILKENHNAIDWENALNGFDKDCELLVNYILPDSYKFIGDIVKASMKETLKNRVKIVADKFNQSEKQESYKDIKRILRKTGVEFIKRLENNDIKHLAIYNTNYDSLFDSILTDLTGNSLFYDSFNSNKSNGLHHLNLTPFITFTHIHGAFNYIEKEKQTYKLKANQPNDNPVIILNSSDSKETLIKENDLLEIYWNKFTTDLKNFDRVIILGNSLNSEPHIKKALKENFDRSETELVICSNNCDSVEENLKGYYNQFIYKFSTDGIIREHDLWNLLYQIFNEDLENCSFWDFYKTAA